MTTRSTRAGVIPTATISPGRTAPELLAFTPQGVVRAPFAPGAAVVIGRSTTSDLVVDAPSVSRQHARFECGARPTVTDLGSRNGTFVRGARIAAAIDDRVRVVLEVYVGDIGSFEALVPDDWLQEKSAARPSRSERLREFAAKTLRIVTDDGHTLPVELKLAEPRLRKDRNAPFAGMIDPVTRQRLPEPPADKRVLYAELEYPFAGKPKHLTIIPSLDAQGKPSVSIGFIAYHKAVPIVDFRYLAQAERLTLDWDDPWYTAFGNSKLNRHHKSALMSFLYVEPREVRHEVLIRVRELQEWTDLGLSGSAVIDAADQSRIKERARAFFAARNPLSIDAVPAEPASVRVEFLDISLTGVQLIEDARALDLSTAMLGVMLIYPVKHLPQDVVVHWDLFSNRVTQVPATSIDPAGPFPSFIEASDPRFAWRNFLRNYQEPQVTPVVVAPGRSIGVPLLSLMLLLLALGAASRVARPAPLSRTSLSRKQWIASAAVSTLAAVLLLRVAVIDVANPLAGPPDEVAAAQILSGVLANVSHAYLEKDPQALQQALQVVVTAEALGDVEKELDRALAIKVAGGGIARVDAVEDVVLKDVVALEGRPGFRALAEWTAKASAGHWGHAHRRTIRFRALVELVDVEGNWKLAGITVTDAKQET